MAFCDTGSPRRNSLRKEEVSVHLPGVSIVSLGWPHHRFWPKLLKAPQQGSKRCDCTCAITCVLSKEGLVEKVLKRWVSAKLSLITNATNKIWINYPLIAPSKHARYCYVTKQDQAHIMTGPGSRCALSLAPRSGRSQFFTQLSHRLLLQLPSWSGRPRLSEKKCVLRRLIDRNKLFKSRMPYNIYPSESTPNSYEGPATKV